MTLRPRRVALVETVRWSTRSALASALSGLLIGFVSGLPLWFAISAFTTLLFGSIDVLTELGTIVLLSLATGLISGLVFGISGGMRGRELDTRITPNQGIRRSLRQAVRVGGVVMLAVGLLGGLAWMRLSGQAGDLVQAVLLLGVPIGVIHALAFGGYACIAHAAMRLVLRRSNALPLDLVPFLEYATERVFLRRVGGGYVFVHRLLQEYFAVHPTVSDAITTGRFLQAGAPPAAARAASAAPGHGVVSGGLVDTLDAEGGRVLVIGGQQAGTIDARAVYATAELDPRMRKDRDRMLGRVRRLWIQGRLDQLAHADPLEPRVIQERPDAVPDRWSALVQQPDRPSPARWSERTLLDGFDAFDGELLILGEAGMGKTRLLLELCGALLDRAEQEDVLPVPAVFALSAWSAARQRLPLSTWLANELTGRYAVPSPIAARWVAEDRILPLLDGLDRVPAAQRSACVSAITTFREGRTRDLLGLVVTSRTADYLALDVRLTLRGAVEVHRGA